MSDTTVKLKYSFVLMALLATALAPVGCSAGAPDTIAVKIARVSPETCRYSGTTIDCTGRFQGAVLTGDSLAGVPASTTALHLRNNGFSELPAGVFDGLGKLKKLDLAYNNLGRLDPPVFDALTSLEELDLNYNRIYLLSESVFDRLGNLLSLSLTGNLLNEDAVYDQTSFPPTDHSSGPFDKLVNLRALSMSLNPLHQIPTGLFKNLHSLEFVNIAQTQLHRFDPGVFDGLTNIVGYNIAESPFAVEWPADLFKHCQRVEVILFPAIFLDSVPLDIFKNCPNPKFPTGFEGKTFTAIPKAPWLAPLKPTVASVAALGHLPADIKQLSLRGMGLKSVPTGVFDRFRDLETLDMSYNELASLPPGLFDQLTKLKTLTLGQNKLVSLPERIFDRLGNLTKLDLTANRLREFPAGVFDGLSKLESLTLDNNPISLASFKSSETAFDKLTSLKVLSLNWMYLPQVPQGWLRKLANLESFIMFSTRTREIPAGFFDGNPKLTYVDLASQDLTSLPAGLFDKLPALAYLWLLDDKFPSWDSISKALTPEVSKRLKGVSTWANPGWHTRPLFVSRDYHFCNVFTARCED